MGQFQTYPEDAANEKFVWVAFARYDAWYEDPAHPEDSYSDSGRCAYVTTSEEDARKTFDRWCTGQFNDEHYVFGVRRGFVQSYPSLEDAELVDVFGWCDEVEWSKDLEPEFAS